MKEVLERQTSTCVTRKVTEVWEHFLKKGADVSSKCVWTVDRADQKNRET